MNTSVQDAEAGDRKFTIADLYKQKSQQLIKSASKDSTDNEKRKAAVYNAHHSQMVLLYIKSIADTMIDASHKRATDTSLDENIGMLFSKS